MPTKRSEAVKKAWRTRKREKAYKGICAYCHEPVWVRGVVREGKHYHDNCYTMHVFKVPK